MPALALQRLALHAAPVLLALGVACGAPAAPSPLVARLEVRGDSQTPVVGDTLSMVVVARDAAGRPVAGERLGAAVVAGGGTASVADPTDARGETRLRWTVGTIAGAQVVEIASLRSAHPAVRATAIAQPGPAVAGAFASTQVSLFAGEPRPAAVLGFTARDRHGNAIREPRVRYEGAGLVFVNETVRADAAGTVVVVARVDSIARSVTVSVLDDLRRWRWRLTYACALPVDPALPDSLAVELLTTSVRYEISPPFELPTATGQFTFSGTERRYRGGAVDEVAVNRTEFFVQGAATLTFPSAGAVAVRRAEPDPRFEGGSLCPASYQRRPGMGFAPAP